MARERLRQQNLPEVLSDVWAILPICFEKRSAARAELSSIFPRRFVGQFGWG